MLPSVHNTLRVVLCPDKVLILGRGKGFRPATSLRVSLLCDVSDHSGTWQAAILTFETWLKANPQPRARVNFVLSNRFVRYALVPWSDEVRSRREGKALAEAVFADIYGDLICDWTIAVGETGYQQPKLAAAVETKFLESLTSVCNALSLSLGSVQPWLTVAYSYFQPSLDVDSGFFAVAEGEQLATLSFQGKALIGVRKDVIPKFSQLVDCIQREKMWGGLEPVAPFYLHAEQHYSVQAKGLVHLLHVSEEQGHFEMALADNPRQGLTLEFHPRRVTGSPSGWGLLSSGLLLLILLLYLYAAVHSQHLRMQQEIAQNGAMIQQARKQASDPRIMASLQQAAGVIEQLSLPWNRLFAALESSSTSDVALLAVQPDLPNGLIILKGEAKNWHAMVAYVRRLNEQQFFTGVQLTSHQIQQSDPQKPIRFVVQCTWGAPNV